MLSLDSLMIEVPKVGQSLNAKLNKLGIHTIRDLIFYFPFRYEDYSRLLTIKQLTSGELVTIKARIDLIKSRRSFRQRRILVEAVVSDQSDSIKVVWFNQPWVAKNLKIGEVVFLSGKVSSDLLENQLINPAWEKVGQQELTNTARLTPVYWVTESLSVKQMRYLLRLVWPLVKTVAEDLPQNIVKKNDLADLAWSLEQIHFPDSWPNLNRALRRLKFNELFYWQLHSQYLKAQLAQLSAPSIPFALAETKKFVSLLPFTLTDEQKKTAWEIILDLQKNRPASRLLIGEVGSGKTVVAALAALNCLLAGHQTALLAPTEILARQHFVEFCKLYSFWSDKDLKIALFTAGEQEIYAGGQLTKIKKSELVKGLKNGEISLVIGTQALLSGSVDFAKLGLVIVDEQHRFGVLQRQALRQKSQVSPHFLALSATPIPRTLALALYSDLAISLITHLPKERKPISTQIFWSGERNKAYELIKNEIALGHQAFVICPIIDPSDSLGVKSVTEECERLRTEIFPNFTVGLLHGKMKSAEKKLVMESFLANKINILVATSVIEVGINIPNATVMAIEGAERFGLAQLHQFRGRVGRGPWSSYCLLFAENVNLETKRRLQSLVECQNGFELAERDLQFRGAGEMFGREQSGSFALRLATLHDKELIDLARRAGEEVIKKDPELSGFPELKKKILASEILQLD